ncbi:MAG: phospholipase D family protein [Acetomicrobium sp.]|nr:phospholipase D family protein [Acetomicrobium sp.]
MEFLSGKEYYSKVQEFFSDDNPLYIAVAFWGIDAYSLFNLRSNKKIQLICNLESGACNPDFIKRIMNSKNVEVRTNSRLHAKLLLQQNKLIVGSANISANGLSFENSELNGWIEAGVLIDDASIIEDASGWFLNIWRTSDKITKDKLDIAIEKWEKRRNQRDVKTYQMSLLHAAMHDTEAFKDRRIYFVIYRDRDITPEAYAKFEEAKQSRTYLRGKIDFYEGWSELPDNAYLIDIYYGPRKEIEVTGIYWTPYDPWIEYVNYNDDSKGDIKIVFKRNSILGYKLTDKDRDIIKRHIDVLWAYDDKLYKFIPFTEGVKLLKEKI